MIISKRTLPINLKAGEEALFQHELKKKFPDYQLTAVSNALITPDGVVWCHSSLEENSLFSPAHKSFYGGLYKAYYLSLGWFAQSQKRQMILAFDAWSFGYFHWMTEFIPRLFKVRHLIAESTVILPSINNGVWNSRSARNSIFKKGLSIVGEKGYGSESVIAFDCKTVYYHRSREVVRAKKLLIPSHLADSGNYNDEVMRELRAFYFSYYKIENKVPFKRLFITRRLANRRSIKNEQDVIKEMNTYGFETVVLEDLSFAEQVKLMSETSFLIGQHGAGLTNIMFMQEQSYVMELKTEGDSNNHCYFSLASAMKVHYLYQFCKGDGRSTQDADILVDRDELLKNILFVQGRL